MFILWLQHVTSLLSPSPPTCLLSSSTHRCSLVLAVTARQGLTNLLEKSTPFPNFPLPSIKLSKEQSNPVWTCQNQVNQTSQKQLKHAASLLHTATNNLGRVCITQLAHSQPVVMQGKALPASHKPEAPAGPPLGNRPTQPATPPAPSIPSHSLMGKVQLHKWSYA